MMPIGHVSSCWVCKCDVELPSPPRPGRIVICTGCLPAFERWWKAQTGAATGLDGEAQTDRKPADPSVRPFILTGDLHGPKL